MWWQVLPSAAVISALLSVPGMLCYSTNMFFLDVPHRRMLTSVDDKAHYLRDRRLNNISHPYLQVGMENLAEYCEPPVQKEEECECPPKKSKF